MFIFKGHTYKNIVWYIRELKEIKFNYPFSNFYSITNLDKRVINILVTFRISKKSWLNLWRPCFMHLWCNIQGLPAQIYANGHLYIGGANRKLQTNFCNSLFNLNKAQFWTSFIHQVIDISPIVNVETFRIINHDIEGLEHFCNSAFRKHSLLICFSILGPPLLDMFGR